MQEVVKALLALLKGDFSGFATHMKAAISGLMDTIKSLIKAGLEFIKGVFATFGVDIVAKAKQWGVDMINGLINGIKGMIGKVRDAISSVADVISSFIHFSEPDVGPLSNFDTFMPDMMKQMAQGIKKGIPLVANAMNSLTGNMAGSLSGGVGSVSAGAMAAGNVSNTTNTNTVNINVYGAQGQDVNELANAVQEIINDQIYSKGAVFA